MRQYLSKTLSKTLNKTRKLDQMPFPRLQKPESKHDGRHEKDQRANHPHHNRTGSLVGERRDVERVWLSKIVAVNWPIAEGEKRRKHRIHNIRHHQVQQQPPSGKVLARRPGMDHRPPEQNRRPQKTQMLKLMPPFVLQREIIRSGHMPAKESQIHRQPRNQRRNEEVAQIAKPLDTDERAEEINPNYARKPAQ